MLLSHLLSQTSGPANKASTVKSDEPLEITMTVPQDHLENTKTKKHHQEPQATGTAETS